MFLGTTTAPVRDFIGHCLKSLKPKRVFEPCAGNFVVSMLCGAIDKQIRVFSGDVSMYSVAIGHYFAGQDSGIRLVDIKGEEYPHFSNRTDPLDIAALMLIFAELAGFELKQHVRYYQGIVRDVRNNQEKYLASTKERLQKAKALMGDFHFNGQDASVTLASAKPGDMVFYDPPYWVDGYDKMFAAMQACFTAPAIEFEPINDESKKATLCDLRDRGVTVFFRQQEATLDVEGYRRVFTFEYKPGGFYNVFSNDETVRAAHGRAVLVNEEPGNYDVLFGDDTLAPDADIRFERVACNVGNHYRLLWTKKANVVPVRDSFGLFIGGKLLGIVSLFSGQKYNVPLAIIFSDAAPLHTKYKRLGKLVLMAILSEQFLNQVNDHFLYEHDGFSTVAYSNSPV